MEKVDFIKHVELILKNKDWIWDYYQALKQKKIQFQSSVILEGKQWL